MTPERFATIRTELGWSIEYIARRLKLPANRVRLWASGRSEMPENVDEWLENAVQGVEEMPLPRGWIEGKQHVGS